MKPKNSRGERRACETLESRRLLCNGVYDFHNFATDFPVEAGMLAKPAATRQPSRAPNSADIVWVNRGASSDNFTSVFGANAEIARNVIDAVIISYERVITSFNQADNSNVINVTVSMSGSGTGHGGGASDYTENSQGQPTGGAIVMDRGDDTTGDGKGDGGGYFVDPTPFDYSEFNGSIVNAFSVNAPVGSVANGKADLFTLFAAELTHVLGVNSGSNLYNSRAHYTNTNIADTAEGGGVGKFYAYDSTPIDHLMTSNNGGASGSDRGKPLHGAGPGVPIVFGGQTWEGAQDTMNASYENSRRYLIPETARLIMQDGLSYTTTPAQAFGTAYTIVDETARTLTVRGAGTVSDDVITVDFTGGKIVVSVDVPVDFAGTWTSPGGGNFPAWTSSLSPINFDTIIINGGDGNDTIRVLGVHPLQTVTVNGDNGNDSITIGNGAIDNTIGGPVTVNGGAGSNDTLIYNDANDTVGDDAYQITSTFVQKSASTRATYDANIESITVSGSTTNNTFNMDSGRIGAAYIFLGNGGNDTFNVGWSNATSVNAQGGSGNNTLHATDLGNSSNYSYTINNAQVARVGAATTITHSSVQNVILDAASTANTINIAMDNGAPATIVNGNDGNDTILVDLTHYTGRAVEAPITINGNAGTDGSSVFVKNGGTSNVIGNAITGNNATVNYGTLEELDLVGTSSAETFVLYSTPAGGMNMQIFAGDGNDFIYLGGYFNQPYTLDNVQAPLIVRGEAGSDVVTMFDTLQTGNRTWQINTLGVTGTGGTMASIGLDTTVDGLVMNTGAGQDTFNVLATLASTALTVNGGGGADTFNITNHATNVPVNVDGGAGLDIVNVNTDNSGTAIARFFGGQDLAALNIGTGGSANLLADGHQLLSTQTLSLSTTSGKLDINDNDFIATTTPLATIASFIRTAYHSGLWNGAFGIFSTTAKNNATGNTTLGAMSGADYLNNNGSPTFDGATVHAGDAVVKYTYFGDVDFNGSVDVSDYNIIDFGFANHLTGWANGDADYSAGPTDVSDYNIIDFAFTTQSGVL